MALLDQGFVHFTFSNYKVADIAVFNTELHDKRTNAVLFVVAKFTQIDSNSKGSAPLWTMNKMMTARQLFSAYGINECDLPTGSRSKRNYFQSHINSHYEMLQSLVSVSDWNKIPILPNKKAFDRDDVSNVDLNQAIAESIERIKDCEDELELIPILTIKGRVYCDVLIPIRVKSKWFAISYKTSTIRPYKATVTGLCVDADDILNKASLVDPNAVTAYDYILNRDEMTIYDEDDMKVPQSSRPQLQNFDSANSVCSVRSDIIDASHTVNGLQAQLAAALQREKDLVRMLMNQTKLKNSHSMNDLTTRSRQSFMSLSATSSPALSPVMSSMPTPSTIASMQLSRSHPILPMIQQNVFDTPSPSVPNMAPLLLGGLSGSNSGFNTPTYESSPSFGPVNGY